MWCGVVWCGVVWCGCSSYLGGDRRSRACVFRFCTSQQQPASQSASQPVHHMRQHSTAHSTGGPSILPPPYPPALLLLLPLTCARGPWPAGPRRGSTRAPRRSPPPHCTAPHSTAQPLHNTTPTPIFKSAINQINTYPPVSRPSLRPYTHPRTHLLRFSPNPHAAVVSSST